MVASYTITSCKGADRNILTYNTRTHTISPIIQFNDSFLFSCIFFNYGRELKLPEEKSHNHNEIRHEELQLGLEHGTYLLL